MFDDKFFEDWLDNQAQNVMTKISKGEGIAPEQMMILMLKAQTNHFAHLDIELRGEMKSLREDMDKRFDQVERHLEQGDRHLEELDKHFEQVEKHIEQVERQMDKRFEQVDKRFEQIDKRFEQVDKRFEQLTTRIDRFMIWSFATTVSVGGIVVATIKFL